MTPWGGFMRMTREWRSLSLVAVVMMMTTGLAFGQASSTFNGRVLDQGDAVLPGVTVTVTNQNTGVVRTTVTNEEGLIFPAGPRARRVPHRDGVARVPVVGEGRRERQRQRDPDRRFQAVARRGGRGGHRDRRGAADRGDTVEGRLEHRGDRAPESAAGHAQRQRDAGAAARGPCRSSRSIAARRTSAACRMAGPRGRT